MTVGELAVLLNNHVAQGRAHLPVVVGNDEIPDYLTEIEAGAVEPVPVTHEGGINQGCVIALWYARKSSVYEYKGE